MTIRDFVDSLNLFDHHCHGIVKGDLTWEMFSSLLTEADAAKPGEELHHQLGNFTLAVCAQKLDLEAHTDSTNYWQRRTDLGNEESSERLLTASGISDFAVDTGYRGDELTTPAELAAMVGKPVQTISRLESMAEDLILDCDAVNFPDTFRNQLQAASRNSAGFKSVIAYRFGLDFRPNRPDDTEVVHACQEWLDRIESTGSTRLNNEVLHRFLLWSAVDIGKPIQIHIGFGDTDITLHRCDPSQMTEFLRLTEPTGTPIVLLHCYPYVRQAAILCQIFSHVWMDTSLGVAHAGFASDTTIRESLEMAPFSRLLFASDAFGLAEIYLAGAWLWRRGMAKAFDPWIAEEAFTVRNAERIIEDIAFRNGAALYQIGGS